KPITLGINGAVHFSMAKKTWLEKLNELLVDNIKDPNLTNADLAEQLLMSERAFYRKVKEETGYSPNHYLRKIRLQTARQLLLSGKFLQVQEVAHQVGFRKVSYFSQLFEKTFGKKPIEYLDN
ncbi:MAG: helix-turn-helix transcriptional regulator, partial [Saprospiraceae bacterium]